MISSPKPKLSSEAAKTVLWVAAQRIAARRSAVQVRSATDEEIDRAIEECSDFPRGFRAFLPFWHFINRESGFDQTFEELWPGQQAFRDLMVRVGWLYALKAGKLGFTELEVAWDGYVATFGSPNARVHLFSKELQAAQDLLQYVRYGLQHLPPAFGVRILAEERGGDTMRSLRLRVDRPSTHILHDIRTVYAYAMSKNPAIDKSAQHAHIDEWAHMEDPKGAFNAIRSTVAPGSSCHIVTRGAGENEYVQDVWTSAEELYQRLAASGFEPGLLAQADRLLVGFFSPWTARPRPEGWIEREAMGMTSSGAAHYLAETPADAFMGDEDNPYLEIEWWDACRDESLPPLEPGDKTPIVLAADAGTVSDYFAITATSRHPKRPNEPAIRAVRVWKPEHFPDKRIHYDAPENWIRLACQGGCVEGHAQTGGFKKDDCSSCQNGELMPPLNVVELAYDNHQLEDMMQRLRRDRVVHAREFPQGDDRYESDRMLRNRVINRQLSHNGDPALREAIGNAKAKLQKGQESKLRMEKKAPHRHIDAAVSASMGVYRCLRLNL